MRARLQAFAPRVDASPNSRIVFWAVLNGLSAISQLVSGEVSCERGIVSIVIVLRYWLLCFWRLAGGRGRGAIGISVLSLRISFLYDGSGVCGIVSSHSAKNGFLRLWPSFAFLTLAAFVFLSAFYDYRPVWMMSSSTRSHCWRMDRCLWKQWETCVVFTLRRASTVFALFIPNAFRCVEKERENRLLSGVDLGVMMCLSGASSNSMLRLVSTSGKLGEREASLPEPCQVEV